MFERANGVSLPDGYRDFLLLVGDGGLGPGHGLCELSTWRTVELPGNVMSIELPEGTFPGLRVAYHGGADVTVLLLTGSFTGRLVDLVGEVRTEVRQERDFTEWYLNWLMAEGVSLRVTPPRPEHVLVDVVLGSPDGAERARAVHELGALPDVAAGTVELVEQAALRDPCPGVRFQAVQLMGELDLPVVGVYLAALRDPSRSVRRRALVHLLRLAGDTSAWQEGLAVVRSTSDAATVHIADDLEERRARGTVIPEEVRQAS